MDYEISRDAAKFMSDDKDVPQLFTLDATSKYYAINERPLGNGIVSVGIYTGKSGTYTLSLVDATVTADEVILTDKTDRKRNAARPRQHDSHTEIRKLSFNSKVPLSNKTAPRKPFLSKANEDT